MIKSEQIAQDLYNQRKFETNTKFGVFSFGVACAELASAECEKNHEAIREKVIEEGMKNGGWESIGPVIYKVCTPKKNIDSAYEEGKKRGRQELAQKTLPFFLKHWVEVYLIACTRGKESGNSQSEAHKEISQILSVFACGNFDMEYKFHELSGYVCHNLDTEIGFDTKKEYFGSEYDTLRERLTRKLIGIWEKENEKK